MQYSLNEITVRTMRIVTWNTDVASHSIIIASHSKLLSEILDRSMCFVCEV